MERMVRRLGEASEREYRLIRLSEREIAPCRGCVRSAALRRCVQNDGMADLYPALEEAEGLIIGGTNVNARFDSLARIFLERLFPLYHPEPALRGKPAAIVAVGGEEPENAGEAMRRYLEGIHFLRVVGTALERGRVLRPPFRMSLIRSGTREGSGPPVSPRARPGYGKRGTQRNRCRRHGPASGGRSAVSCIRRRPARRGSPPGALPDARPCR
ncbi:MAG: flavodoxin family protein [Desulfohalobiaceae bacterium]